MYETLPPTLHYKYTLRTPDPLIPSHTTPPDSRSTTTPTFDAYIQCLDQWEYYLLRDSTINTDVFRLSETIQNNPKIIAASDGSVSSSVRAYGWICSLPHGQRLATNHGPVFGSLPSSIHAEAYGLLSYL